MKQVVKGEAVAAATDQSTTASGTHRPTKTRFVTSIEADKPTLEVGKDDVLSPNKKTVQDEVDILVDAIQLG